MLWPSSLLPLQLRPQSNHRIETMLFLSCSFSSMLILSLMDSKTAGFSIGAPDSACTRMTPSHGFDPQPGSSPVIVETTSTTLVAPTQSLVLRMRVADNESESVTFKGFMVQTRSLDNEAQGSFVATPGLSNVVTCGQKGIHNSVTHTNSEAKRVVDLKWTAPDQEMELRVIFSVVTDYNTYWVAQEGPSIRVSKEALSTQPIQFPDNPDNENDDQQEITTTTTTTTSTSTTTMTTTTTTTTSVREALWVPSSHSVYSGCGLSKTCFGTPSDCIESRSCTSAVSYEPSGDGNWRFELTSMLPNANSYLAVGLSLDGLMGDDLVTFCRPNGDQVDVVSALNLGYSNLLLTPPSKAIVEESEMSSFEDGVLTCVFNRPDKVHLEEHSLSFDLTHDAFVIFLAEGGVTRGGDFLQHRSKEKSATPLRLGRVTDLEVSDNLLIKMHGVFMILAWISSASLGIMVARYFKNTWTNKSCLSKPVWFFVHRTLMVTTWLLTMAAVVLMAVELQGWSQLDPLQDNPHAVLGGATTVLCFVQPLLALVRPHPEARTRFLFNFVHWFLGNAAQIIGIVCIHYAVGLSKARLPAETHLLLMVFVVMHVLIHCLMSILSCCTSRKRGTDTLYDEELYNRDEAGKGSRQFLFFLYFIINVLLAAGLVIAVLLGQEVHSVLRDQGLLPHHLLNN